MNDEMLIEILKKEIDCWMEVEPEDRGDMLVAARAICEAALKQAPPAAPESERQPGPCSWCGAGNQWD